MHRTGKKLSERNATERITTGREDQKALQKRIPYRHQGKKRTKEKNLKVQKKVSTRSGGHENRVHHQNLAKPIN